MSKAKKTCFSCVHTKVCKIYPAIYKGFDSFWGTAFEAKNDLNPDIHNFIAKKCKHFRPEQIA